MSVQCRWGTFVWTLSLVSLGSGCGPNPTEDSRRGQNGDSVGEANAEGRGLPRLESSPTDQVLASLVVPLGRDSLSLVGDSAVQWVVDMEAVEHVEAGVAPDRYLKIKGDLTVPRAAENRPYDVGCLYVELKDNVYYRESTWLRLATRSGITGKTYKEVILPTSVDLGGWQAVPVLDDSIALKEFGGNTIKRFDGTLCFRMDFTNAPAQDYEGELIVQYLRPGEKVGPVDCSAEPNHPDCAPCDDDDDGAQDGAADGDEAVAPFACAMPPAVLKSGQEIDLSWTGTASELALTLAADPASYNGDRGSIVRTSNGSARYRAPARVTSKVRVIATARPMGVETFPAFCEVHLVPDEEIGVHDDGEIVGLAGNVYRLPANTSQLPDFGAMTPVDRIVTPNLDIPERSFSAGFPGVKDLFEWFGIRFNGQLLAPDAGQCSFRLTADDGAILYINGQKVVDNDGVHPTRSVDGATTLARGSNTIRVDYFQGPRYHISLQLLWKCGAATQFSVIPPSAFARPLQ